MKVFIYLHTNLILSAYEVEEICDRTYDEEEKELFQVKWKNWDQNTWKPAENLNSC